MGHMLITEPITEAREIPSHQTLVGLNQGAMSKRKGNGCHVVIKAAHLYSLYAMLISTEKWVGAPKISTGFSPTSRTWGTIRQLFL